MRPIDIAGQRFGRLVALHVEPLTVGKKQRQWRCRCDCGNETLTTSTRLRNGDTKSCGCLHKEVITGLGRSRKKHGMRGAPEYRVWAQMRSRCHNPNDPNYPHYGGRGISVCVEWESFERFFADMGRRPPNTSIDRIDVDGNYAPENCRWATPTEQSNNKRTNHVLEFDGEALTVAEWARRIGISDRALLMRIRAGWSVEEALTVPLGMRRAVA